MRTLLPIKSESFCSLHYNITAFLPSFRRACQTCKKKTFWVHFNEFSWLPRPIVFLHLWKNHLTTQKIEFGNMQIKITIVHSFCMMIWENKIKKLKNELYWVKFDFVMNQLILKIDNFSILNFYLFCTKLEFE